MPVTVKYTFLIPAYKLDFFREAIRGICNQNFDCFSAIVSDDCSPEELKSVVDEFSDDRIKYQRTDSNIGGRNLVDHWNLLLSQCDSEYLIIAADDDVYAPNFLEEVDKLVRKYPEADLIHVRSRCIDAEGNTLKEDPRMPEYVSYEDFLLHFLSLDNVLCIGNFVFRTEALKRIGGFVKFPLAWKSDTATQIAMAANGVVNSDEVLFSFRMSGLNISSNAYRDAAKDRLKLNALVQFGGWLKEEIFKRTDQDAGARILNAFLHRLEGESRSYYSCLSFGEFYHLFKEFLRDGWFGSSRNKMSFVWRWLRLKLAKNSR